MPIPAPTVFLASSGTAVPMVKALHRCLKDEGIICQEWKADDTFGGYTYTDLLEAASKCHYAICVMWPDDELKIPKAGKTHVTRDNVVFEAGLFSGVLSPNLWKNNVKAEKRTFLWVNNSHSSLHIPTDLTGLHQARYTFSGNLQTVSLNALVKDIETDVRVLASTILTHWKTLNGGIDPDVSLSQSIVSCFKRDWTTAPPKPPPLSFTPRDVLLDVDDVYDSFVASGSTPQNGVVIVDRDTRWIWDLFPIVLHWRSLGYPVSVVTEKPASAKQADEARRRTLLVGLGCEIVEASVKQRFLVLNPDTAVDTIAFQFEHERHYVATRRTRSADPANLAEIDKQLLTYGLKFKSIANSPKIGKASEDEIVQKLTSSNGPSAYQQTGVTMRMEDVILEQSSSISISARAYRFRQTEHIISLLSKNSIPLFEPAAVEFANGARSLITPPVVEERGGRFVFIEGNTRALHSFCRNQNTIRCLVVRGVTTALPAAAVPFDQVLMCRLKLPAAWRQIDWNYNTFRNIEAAVHNH